MAMVELEPVPEEDELLERLHHHGGDLEFKGRIDVSGDMTSHDEERLQLLISNHVHYTGSTKGKTLGIVPFEDPSNEDVDVPARLGATRAHALAERRSVAATWRRCSPVKPTSCVRSRELLDDLARRRWPSTTGSRSSDLAGLRRPVARRAVRCWLGVAAAVLRRGRGGARRRPR